MPPYYENEIKLTITQLTKSRIVPDLQAGMELMVDILGGKRTILEYIMSPILKPILCSVKCKATLYFNRC